MATKEMTKREMLIAVAEGQVTEEVKEKAAALLVAMDSEAEKRKEKAAEKRAEKIAGEKVFEDAILEFLDKEEHKTASDVKDAIDGIETPQKATAILKRLVEAGLVNKTEVKGKSGKVKGYTLA